MFTLTEDAIKNTIAHSPVEYARGEGMYARGQCKIARADRVAGVYVYLVQGEFSDYEVTLSPGESGVRLSCSCPSPVHGCAHAVAACLDAKDRFGGDDRDERIMYGPEDEYLTPGEIREDAIRARMKRAASERYTVTQGLAYKGEHLVTTSKGKQYLVTVYDPVAGLAHCACPDFRHNRLGLCKHALHLLDHFRKDARMDPAAAGERFPHAHFFWHAEAGRPAVYAERDVLEKATASIIGEYFDADGLFRRTDPCDFFEMADRLAGARDVRMDEFLVHRMRRALHESELDAARRVRRPDYAAACGMLYPYQREGVAFGLFKNAVVIADEMGLGKTAQAIMLALMKRREFGFGKALVIVPASVKEQWRREIARFAGQEAVIVRGARRERRRIYEHSDGFFFITNYEAVLKDVLSLRRFRPDIVILDEAQRIKNFRTRTHEAISSLPRRHAILLTGTPLENRLEELYAVMQFADPERLGPLWQFAAAHYRIKRRDRSRIAGYHGLDLLHRTLADIVIRRRKEEVLDSLPEVVTHNHYVGLAMEQASIHAGYEVSLACLLRKETLTPFEMELMFRYLTGMRMVCDSTFLIDRRTHISPKLAELALILEDVVVANGRKAVIYTEWTTMTFLIGRMLSSHSIPFVEFTGRVPVEKRQALVNEFMENPRCSVFLSTDAGGLGLNLQGADCLINIEPPWNPAKLNQRIGRLVRIGQQSASVNVINFISRDSIEERVWARMRMKQKLFDAAVEGMGGEADFSESHRSALIDELRALMGEKPVRPARDRTTEETIPESTPHFLNLKAFARDE
jgi:superfamily II DNA or RNA helicase